MKKLLALAVSLAISITAFPADTANAPDAHIKAEIAKRGTGEKARVRITTRDNRQMSGYTKKPATPASCWQQSTLPKPQDSLTLMFHESEVPD